MKLVFTPEAERQASAMDAWWREHRAKAPGLFARELAEITALILGTPATTIDLSDYQYSGSPQVEVVWTFLYWDGPQPKGTLTVTLPAR